MPLEEGQRAGRLALLEPRAVAELDERHERRQALVHPFELGERLARLDEARVVLDEHSAQLPRQLERLERGAELPVGLVEIGRPVQRHRRSP